MTGSTTEKDLSMTNPIIEAASRFSAKTQATVDGILAEGTIFARRVRRDLIIADVSKNGDMDNCIGDLVKAAMLAQQSHPASAAYYRMAEQVLGEARMELSKRHTAILTSPVGEEA